MPATFFAVAGAEAAMEWVLAHMADPDFNDPIALAGESVECVLLAFYRQTINTLQAHLQAIQA
jgi:hypothetical protein